MPMPYDVIYSSDGYIQDYENRLGQHMARDSAGNIWVAFGEYGAVGNRASVLYSSDGGVTWTHTVIATKSYAIRNAFLAIDGLDRPHVFFHCTDGLYQLSHYVYSGGSWSGTVHYAPSPWSWYYDSHDACVDTITGRVHVSFTVRDTTVRPNRYGLVHLEFDGLTAVTNELVYQLDVASWGYNTYLVANRIVCDSSGNLHLIDHTGGLFSDCMGLEYQTRLWHCMKSPATGWGPRAVIYQFHDQYANWADNDGSVSLCADGSGNVHLASNLGMDCYEADEVWTDIEYRKWVPGDGWGGWERVADKVVDDGSWLGNARVALLQDGSPFVAWTDWGYGEDDQNIVYCTNVWYSWKAGSSWHVPVNVTWDDLSHLGLNICLREPGTPRLMWIVYEHDDVAMLKVELPSRRSYAYVI